MWYFVVALIIWAIAIAVTAVILRAHDLKQGLTTDWDDVREAFQFLLGITGLAGLAWPLTLTVVLFVVLFNLFFKDWIDSAAEWLKEKL
jgi:hypothetical protein